MTKGLLNSINTKDRLYKILVQTDTNNILCETMRLNLKGTDQTGTFMSLKCVVYYANYRSGHQSSKIQVVP